MFQASSGVGIPTGSDGDAAGTFAAGAEDAESAVVRSPLAGRVIAVGDVPDPVFATGMLGPGVAIDPDRAGGGEVSALAPVAGTVAKIHPHAFIVTGTAGRSVLVHLGLDTVQLEGAGFTLHVAEGDAVAVGDPVVTWCPAAVEAGGRNPIVPVIALQAEGAQVTTGAAGGHVEAGMPLFTWA
ncbi:PTS sugar transporter subunit IIA [Actinomyces succiniciruminis]|uniref:PTS glucose porter, IIA component n=1 Tax=Actinomyces succiniciruminis TaxID=1522002 RepID=A0A1L7R800_9ACTO|nr:PTS glucose transporter subunit IIA [Actinomyces succiniciruminis]CED89965.1 PTS glucose porter, IIA component [Actinomyces succiniciruminis]